MVSHVQTSSHTGTGVHYDIRGLAWGRGAGVCPPYLLAQGLSGRIDAPESVLWDLRYGIQEQEKGAHTWPFSSRPKGGEWIERMDRSWLKRACERPRYGVDNVERPPSRCS